MPSISLFCVNIGIMINQQFNQIYVTLIEMNQFNQNIRKTPNLNEWIPLSVARWMGMVPSFVRIFKSALLLSNTFATSTASVYEFENLANSLLWCTIHNNLPFKAAQWSALKPSLSTALTFAPLAIKIFTTFTVSAQIQEKYWTNCKSICSLKRKHEFKQTPFVITK